MPVYKIENNIVTQVWIDVEDLSILESRYGVSGTEFRVGYAVPGWIETNGELVAPPPPPEPEPPTREEQEAARADAYTQEADPIFFKYQRGEATEQEWLDKVEEIRARYPYPEE